VVSYLGDLTAATRDGVAPAAARRTTRRPALFADVAQVLILGRLLDPSSEMRLAEQVYGRTALADVLGVPPAKINDDRLYRALDALRPHKPPA
jgi:hypothetical protein